MGTRPPCTASPSVAALVCASIPYPLSPPRAQQNADLAISVVSVLPGPGTAGCDVTAMDSKGWRQARVVVRRSYDASMTIPNVLLRARMMLGSGSWPVSGDNNRIQKTALNRYGAKVLAACRGGTPCVVRRFNYERHQRSIVPPAYYIDEAVPGCTAGRKLLCDS